MKTQIVIVSKDSNFKLLQSDFDKAHDIAEISVIYVENNTKTLPAVYNEYLREARKNIESIDNLIFMHSDVSFDVKQFISHLSQITNKYALIGLCGTSTFNVSQSPLNWWTGSNPTPYEKWGCVTHGELGNQTSYFSSHSPNVMDHEVACIDGLCIIFTKDALKSSMEFDEELGQYDFYDSDISMQALMKYKLKIGVMVCKDLCHYSVGKSIMTDAFLETELKIRQKWNFPIPQDSALSRLISSKNA